MDYCLSACVCVKLKQMFLHETSSACIRHDLYSLLANLHADTHLCVCRLPIINDLFSSTVFGMDCGSSIYTVFFCRNDTWQWGQMQSSRRLARTPQSTGCTPVCPLHPGGTSRGQLSPTHLVSPWLPPPAQLYQLSLKPVRCLVATLYQAPPCGLGQVSSPAVPHPQLERTWGPAHPQEELHPSQACLGMRQPQGESMLL